MCVIAFQTTKQEALTFDEVQAMADRNSDGFGLMWTDGTIVEYRKGYFNVDDFYDDYLKVRSNPNNKEVALHLRIGTGSKIDVANCHPFPITKNPNRIKRARGTADVCIMMNGIIGRSTIEFSDTALYVMNNLKPYYDSDKRFWLNWDRVHKKAFENEISGNRFVFMTKEGTSLLGDGWSDYQGKCQVSNRYWIKRPTYDYSNYCYSNLNRAKDRGRYKSYIDFWEDELAD